MAVGIAVVEPDPAGMYAAKADAYFAGARADFVDRLPRNPRAAILEIGCGSGETGALALGDGRAGRYVGIELYPAAAARASAVLSEVLVGDVQHMALEFAPGTFDALILSEVLEHLIEPQAVLARLAPALKPGAVVLASSPNIAHWRVVRELLSGRFDLADKGVFDRTHMRWFTPRTFARMFAASGYDVVRVGPVTPFSARTRALSRLSGGRLDHLFTVQICLEARRRA